MLYIFIPVFFLYMIYESVSLCSNADLPVSVVCDADLIEKVCACLDLTG